MASTTTTKTWTVRGSNGAVHTPARKLAFFTLIKVMADANGQFTFTYPSDPDYLWLTVQVPTSDYDTCNF
jgi:hypothetical protein